MFHVHWKWIDVWHQDMCNFSDNWWMDGRCSRAIVDGFGTAPSEEVVAAEYFAALSLAPGH